MQYFTITSNTDFPGPVGKIIVNDESKSAIVMVGNKEFRVTDDSETGFDAMVAVLAAAKCKGDNVIVTVEGSGNQIDKLTWP